MCRRPEIRKSLQEDYFTERGGRYVLPVQSTLKRNVRGIQHGRSDTGTTAYIEPLELVEAGNLLVESVEEEGREVIRVLRELTREVGDSSPTTRANLDTVAQLDLVVSLADYLLDVRGCLPEIASEGGLELRQVRHPLLLAKLPAAEVVANDLILPVNRSGVIITGPNTGGKTVVLKTAGILCLMALSGLPIPCGPGTRIPVMGGVLADIGDEQSIEQSLSTFSSHISQMTSFVAVSREIRERHAPRPLIVLDELGAGTDPAEGSALGRAFIEELMNLGAWILVATHLGDLKLFGHSHPSLSSGSMRFDSETLSPTYEFLMDTVGESHGLEIASRLGLPGSIVERANELIESDPNQAAALLHRLTEEERAARELREQIEKIKSDIEEKQGTLVRRIEQTARREKDILDTARKEAEHKIASAKKRVADIEVFIAREERKLKKGYDGKERDLEEREKEIAWMERDLEKRMKLLLDLAAKFPNFAPDPLRNLDIQRYRSMRLGEPEWKRILREINQEEKLLASEFPVPKTVVRVEGDVRPEWESICAGDTIRVEGFDRTVTVAEKDDKKKRLIVLVGNLRSEVSWDRVLQRTGHEAPAPPDETGGGGVTRFVAPDIGLELNLIGLTLEEMEPKLTKYLDDAVLSGLGQVRVVHGYGTGVLRAGVEKLLREHPAVRDFRRGEAAEGGGGATVATLKI
jgi:DNA mismatch repair protein MutS2